MPDDKSDDKHLKKKKKKLQPMGKDCFHYNQEPGFPSWHERERTCLPMQERLKTRVQSLGYKDALEEVMATHSSILAWRIP